MHNIRRLLAKIKLLIVMVATLSSAAFAVTWPDAPFGVSSSAPPMALIVSGKDHKLYYEAYNDVSDLDGDGILEIRFNPSIDYYGLFDEKLCYSYDSTKELYEPFGVAGANKTCTGIRWSGNWLNYVTTSRIDSLRKVLYGGYREVDTVDETILRRAYIPQDSHSWAKEYTSEAYDGYKISDYTPFSQPSSTAPAKRHFFGSITKNANVSCAVLDNCSNLPPRLSVIKNSPNRVWEWAATERPVMRDDTHGGVREEYTVRVSVCTATYNDGCKAYPNGKYKPVGLLHDYGEADAMYFGLLTGSYDKHLSGGVLRKVVSSFGDEIDSNTGQFTANSTIVQNFNAFRIRNYNNNPLWFDATYMHFPVTDPYDLQSEGKHVDWGNPIGEMMYEGLRYFAGKASPTPSFDTTGSDQYDTSVGLTRATWDDPFSSASSINAPWCSKPAMLVISDIYPSYDSDQVPGSDFSSFTGDLTGLDVQTAATTISDNEPNIKGLRFIGQSGTNFDGEPTGKNVTSLGSIRGLAPSEPAEQGSYYSSVLAYYGKTNDLNTSIQGEQNVNSFFLALSSPLPNIEFPVNGQLVTIVPFGKTVNLTPNRTNAIVDTYVDTFANMPGMPVDSSVNGGRPYAKLRINFEDVESGGDHDLDSIVEYEIVARADNKVDVNLHKVYRGGANIQQLGYSISGTTDDDVYLLVTSHQYPEDAWLYDRPENVPFIPLALPDQNSRTFQPGGASASLLQDPLWYGAKWGGFKDFNNNNIPDLQYEWDKNSDGTPDNYFYVQNALSLRDTLSQALDNILATTASGTSIAVNGISITENSLVFQSKYETENWSGDVFAYPFTEEGVSDIPKWQASQQLPTYGDRKVFTFTDGDFEPFEWNKLSDADEALIESEDVLDYIRGDRSNETINGGLFRTRSNDSVLGDIIHSGLVYQKLTQTVYVGGNDGMLHAFDTVDGKERFAYIPSVVIPSLVELSKDSYYHEYYVDGHISVFEENYHLVATLGRGAKGLFSLDVSDPTNFDENDPVWEYFDNSDVDLGYMTGKPIIAKMNNGVNAVIVSNGYNSTSGKAVLYIFNLETGAIIKKIDTLVAGDNGLAEPVVFDEDSDGDVDFVYAGDLKGNLWKFDVSQSSATAWKVRFGSVAAPVPFFSAEDASSNPQPITAAVAIAINNMKTDVNHKKPYIIFGTGSYFQNGDPLDTNVQTWYGLLDTDSLSSTGTSISGRSDLKERSILNEGVFSGKPVRTFENAVSGDMSGTRGWYLDFDTQPGERVTTAPAYFQTPNSVVFLSSLIPAVDTCEPGGTGYINVLHPFTGASLGRGTLDIDGDDSFESDKLADEYIGAVDIGIGVPGTPVLVDNILVIGGSIGKIGTIKINANSIAIKGRILWREITNE